MFDTLIQVYELDSLLKNENCLIYDCRFDLADTEKGIRLYNESHIPGAFYAHLDHQLSSPITPDSGRHPMPDMDEFKKWLSDCGFNGSQQLVVYDDSFGAMASRLWWLLKCLGHEAVALLDGGWQAWIESGFEVTDKKTNRIPSNYIADFDDNCAISTLDVINNLNSPEFLLVDVRTVERFDGKAEPIDPVAGHIPGAINIPLTKNLQKSGRYKSPDDLRKLYAPLVDRCPAEQQVYMCGSGVTACHSVLALAVAGYGLPKVYTGSWSEWIRDSARPVVTQDAG